MPMTHFPNGFANGVAIRKMPLLNAYAGNVFWVDSGTGADTGKGTYNSPFATIDYAIGRCTAANGDTIMVSPGHAETLTTAITADIAGVSIIGVGNGDNRPTLTVNAAINGFDITADDISIDNIRMTSSTSATAASRFIRVAASDIKISNCKFDLGKAFYHSVSIISGDDVQILGCTFVNSDTADGNYRSQTAVLNHTGTHILVKDCRFTDMPARQAKRWQACVEGGALTSHMSVEDCTFIIGGIATRTRTAGASDGDVPVMATLFCRAYSPSAGADVGSLFIPTYQYIIESYNVAAVNKVGVVTVTTA